MLNVGHHRALAGGTSTLQLHATSYYSRGHHRALAGGTSTLQLDLVLHGVAVKLKHHRLKPGGVPKSASAAWCSSEIEVPPAKAGGVRASTY